MGATCLLFVALTTTGCPKYVETETPPGQVPPPRRISWVEGRGQHGISAPQMPSGAVAEAAPSERGQEPDHPTPSSGMRAVEDPGVSVEGHALTPRSGG